MLSCWPIWFFKICLISLGFSFYNNKVLMHSVSKSYGANHLWDPTMLREVVVYERVCLSQTNFYSNFGWSILYRKWNICKLLSAIIILRYLTFLLIPLRNLCKLHLFKFNYIWQMYFPLLFAYSLNILPQQSIPAFQYLRKNFKKTFYSMFHILV